MKLNKIALSLFAVSALTMGSAQAADMYIDLGVNTYDETLVVGSGVTITDPTFAFDANTNTGVFNEFTLGQLLTTSVYDIAGGPIGVGSTFVDVNSVADFTSFGLPASGTALDGTTPVTIAAPTATQKTVQGLAPISTDLEGFAGVTNGSWTLDVEYRLEGVVVSGLGGSVVPSYTGGTFSVFFRDLAGIGSDFLALSGTLDGVPSPDFANLILDFDITTAMDDFLYVDDGMGNFLDLNDVVNDAGLAATLRFDTNIDDPEIEDSQLLQVGNSAVRQRQLDSSFTVNVQAVPVPEPSTIAVFGAGLLALAGLRRRTK